MGTQNFKTLGSPADPALPSEWFSGPGEGENGDEVWESWLYEVTSQDLACFKFPVLHQFRPRPYHTVTLEGPFNVQSLVTDHRGGLFRSHTILNRQGQPRDERNRDKISNLLNIADGFLGDHLKLHIIATTNVPMCRLDPAVTRPGRLMGSREFSRLSRVDAQRLAAAKGIVLPDQPGNVTACWIWNSVLSTREPLDSLGARIADFGRPSLTTVEALCEHGDRVSIVRVKASTISARVNRRAGPPRHRPARRSRSACRP